MQGKQKRHGIYLYLLSCILVLELAVILRHKEDALDHAFIDLDGKIILGLFAIIYGILLLKVALSDICSALYQCKLVAQSSSKLYKPHRELKKIE